MIIDPDPDLFQRKVAPLFIKQLPCSCVFIVPKGAVWRGSDLIILNCSTYSELSQAVLECPVFMELDWQLYQMNL